MKLPKLFLPIILSLAAFAVYLLTTAPFNLFLDAPRFVAAIVTLGVANPPEPLYIMLAKPFIYLPLGSYIFRIQVFSALTAALTLIFVYKLTFKLIEDVSSGVILKSKDGILKQTLAGVFALLSLAFSYQFWSQATNVENFILVALIEAVILWLVFCADSKKRVFVGLCAIAFIFGLATGTNPVIASVIPAIILMMWYRRKHISFQQWIVWGSIGTLAVIVVHLYIPIRAAAGPFLNYWRATDFESVWNLSTGAGLNVYVPELGRINGFTGSPEIFLQSSLNYFKNILLSFAVIIVPFAVAGGLYLWRRSKYYFYLLISILIANFIFSGLYYSGNQESWFLISELAGAILAGAGFYYLTTEPEKIFAGRLKIPKGFKHYSRYLLVIALVPLVFWFSSLNRGKLNITGDYIDNLYRPIGQEKAILFGSSDLFDSASFYAHDVPGPHHKQSVVPVTDNMFYIFQWYRDNLKTSSGLEMPDGSKLKYNSADEYSRFVEDFFEKNMDSHKIYVTIPAMRNNFLLVYGGDDQGGSLKLDEKKFKLVPQGMLYQVVPAGDKEIEPKLENFDYTFKTPNFPYQKPRMLERVYNTEVTGLVNEYAYSLVAAGDYYLKQGKETQKVLEFYQKAYEFSPNNVETISRLGNYFGQALGDHAKAAEFFEKALKLEPRNISLLFNLSIAYENSGKIDKAIATLNKVLQFSKGNTQVSTLAKNRLDALKGATPSAISSGSGAISLPPGSQIYQNEVMNLSFSYPKGFKITEGETVRVSNELKGKDELTIDISSHKISDKDDIEKLLELTPLKSEGIPLGSQPITIPGFAAVGKTIGSGEHITFVILMKRNDQGFVLKVYPGDSNKNQDFSQILGTVKTLR